MKNKKFHQLIYFFIFLLIFNSMTAQDNNQDNQVLNSHQQSMASIAALTATGNLEQLKPALNTGLDAGLTINEIKEALVQLYAYCGFPRSLNAINTLMAVVEERKSQGKKDIEGKDASAVSVTDKYKSGKDNLQKLTGKKETDPETGAAAFAPAVDTFLKEHLFADIFNRDVLNFRQREFVTISALAAMPGVQPQLKAHLLMGKNTGITDAQLLELTAIIEKVAGKTQANVLRNTIGQPSVPIIEPDMLVRISEIEIVPEYLEEYKTILEKESSESVKLESGVIAIYPMFQKENPLQIRIIEIYANQKAYKSHLQTPHFQHYKTTTLKMVKSLKLVDMTALDPNTMPLIFDKIGK
ncbi:carboxymuconolactone decarboxylase family protein [Chryseobacterium aahli]|uniref:carboxymuconolactone decarboxylase family protein n=1 Tax=Chryseobacterium aahli TaxID=1278643 RepID=UPI001F60AE92|nr:carboxymuconolactone decarboxylase family protein [Chryseobacterium aahli]MCI3937174.1 carboxymuconolactone decarboxylase family protein [Chryseobacterium aahli]